MLAILHRLLRILTDRGRATGAEGSIGRQPARWRRRSSARLVQGLLDAATRNPAASQFPHPHWEAPLLLRTEVVWACRPALLAIKAALVDTRQPIPPAALRQLRQFLTDPSVSPLFGADPIAACRVAQELRWSFTSHLER